MCVHSSLPCILVIQPQDKGAISSVNLLLNDIGIDQAKDLVGILKEHPTLKTLCGNTGNETELDRSGKMRGAGDAIMLVPDIIDNGAMTTLILKDNRLVNKESGAALGNMLKSNTVLTKLDVSDNTWGRGDDGSGFAQELAIGIKDNGAISFINLLKNNIPVEQAQELVKIMQAKEKLITLCGLSKEETELDFSGQKKTLLDAGDAVLIANDISDMGALLSLNLADNSLGELVPPDGWTQREPQSQEEHIAYGKSFFVHTDGTKQKEVPSGSKPEGVIALANAINDNGAMTSLSLASNDLGVEGAKIIAAVLPMCT
jgi:hypothetical protein